MFNQFKKEIKMFKNLFVKLIVAGLILAAVTSLIQAATARANCQPAVDQAFRTPPMSDYPPVVDNSFHTPPMSDYPPR